MPNRASRRRPGLIDPSTPSAEQLRTLRLALQLRSDSERGETVLFTSAEPGEGKSTIAANYALVSALGQDRVLLVDGDLRNPSLHDLFSVPRGPGLVDLLAGAVQFRDVLEPVGALGNLSLLPAGSSVSSANDLASSARMGDVLRQASEEFDLVVIDSPPLLSASDGAGIAAQEGVDVVLVVRWPARRRPVKKALRNLELIEARLAGLVVNREGRLPAYGY